MADSITQHRPHGVRSRLGLVQRYREEEAVKLLLDGVAFLPVDDIPACMTYLWELKGIDHSVRFK